MKQPELRFKGFTEDWEEVKLEELEDDGRVKLGRGNVIARDKMTGGNPVYSSSSLNNGLMGYAPGYMFDKEMITWSVDGGGYLFYRPKHKFSVTNVGGTLEVLSESIDVKYLSLALQREHSKFKFDYVDKAHPSVIRELYNVGIPSKDEQNKISELFKALDKKIDLQTKKLEQSTQLKQGLMQQIFSQEIRFKSDSGEEYPEWEDERLGDKLKYEQPGKYLVESNDYVEDTNLIPVLTANKSFLLGYTEEQHGVYDKGEVIIFDDFTMDCKLVDFDFKMKSGAIKLLTTVLEEEALGFYHELIKSLNLKPGNHRRHWIALVQEMELGIPCLDEQQKIEELSRKLEQSLENEKSKLEQLKQLKQGLMQRMFI